MSAASDVFAALGGTAGIGAMLYVSVPHAIKAWRGTKQPVIDRAKLLTDDASNAKAEAMMVAQEAKTRAIKESAAPKVTTKKARK